MDTPQLTPDELRAEMNGADPPVILDVREPWEIAIARLDPHVAIPMGEIVARTAELDRNANLVVLCHAGMRSAQVTTYLRRHGFDKARNLTGGIHRWAEDIDPSMAKY